MMARFNYKFQAIEDIKEKIKKNSQKEFAVCQRAVDEKISEINFIQKQIDESYIIKEKLTPQEMIFLEKYRESLNNRLDVNKKELMVLEEEKNNKLRVLVTHHQEHKVFELLKEKKLEEFTKDQLKTEMKLNDDIANQKFNRKEK